MALQNAWRAWGKLKVWYREQNSTLIKCQTGLLEETTSSIRLGWQEGSQESNTKWCTLHSDTGILLRERLWGPPTDVLWLRRESAGLTRDWLRWERWTWCSKWSIQFPAQSVFVEHFISQWTHQNNQISVDKQLRGKRPGSMDLDSAQVSALLLLIFTCTSGTPCLILDGQCGVKQLLLLDVALKGINCDTGMRQARDTFHCERRLHFVFLLGV